MTFLLAHSTYVERKFVVFVVGLNLKQRQFNYFYFLIFFPLNWVQDNGNCYCFWFDFTFFKSFFIVFFYFFGLLNLKWKLMVENANDTQSNYMFSVQKSVSLSVSLSVFLSLSYSHTLSQTENILVAIKRQLNQIFDDLKLQNWKPQKQHYRTPIEIVN